MKIYAGADPTPGEPGGGGDTWEVRMRMVEALLRAFRFERFAYLFLAMVSCMVLLSASVWLFQQKDTNAATAMFGAGGVLTLTIARVLRMWNQAWNLVTGGPQ